MSNRDDPPRSGGEEAGKRGDRGGSSRPGGDVGNALKTIYADTLNEDIPAEMLALLGKLD